MCFQSFVPLNSVTHLQHFMMFFPPVFDCLGIKGEKAYGWIDLGFGGTVKGQGSRS